MLSRLRSELLLVAGFMAALSACGGGGDGTGPPVTVGPPASLALISGDAQTGAVGSALPVQVTVKVADQFGNGVAGATVTWVVTGGGGSVASTTTTTNASGLSSNSWTLGTTLGANTLSVTSGGLTAQT